MAHLNLTSIRRMNASCADVATMLFLVLVEKKEEAVTANVADVLTNNSVYNAVWHIYLFMWKFDIL